MGSFVAGRRIRKLDQLIYVNGVEDSRIWCESIHKGSGLGGTTAEFSVPELLYDSYKTDLQDALVVVYVFPVGGNPNTNPDYVGYLNADAAEVSPSSDRKSFSSQTITSMLSRVAVGQIKHKPCVKYPLVDPVTQKKTMWKPLRVLQDIFGSNGAGSLSGGLPSNYRTRVELGITTPLNDTSDVTALEFSFNLTELGAAVDQVLAAYGDVACFERFDASGKVYLDFYRIQDYYNARSYARLSQWDDPRTSGAIIQNISQTNSSAEVITRVHGYGSPKLYMVSCKSYVEGLTAQSQSVVTKRLIRDWESKWEAIAKANPNLVTKEQSQYTLEASPVFPPLAPVNISSGATSFVIAKPAYAVPAGSVLVNPKTGEHMAVTSYTPPVDPDAENAVGTIVVTRGFNDTTPAEIEASQQLEWKMPGIEHCFRRHRLPKCFEPVKKRKDNPLRKADKKPYPVQVWTYKALQNKNTDESEGEAEKITRGTISTVPTLLEGAHVDLEHGTFTLAKPALEELHMQPGENDAEATARTFTETVVGITFTIEGDEWLHHDTGQPTTQATGLDIDADGLSISWKRDELIFAQHTNSGFPLIDENGADQTFGTVYFDLDDKEKVVIHGTSEPVEIQNDLPQLKQECQQILRERNRRARAYNTTLPMFTRGYEIGQALEILGEANYEFSGDKITGIELVMPIEGAPKTTITTDNVKPPHRRKARVRRGGGQAQQSNTPATHRSAQKSGYYQRPGGSSGQSVTAMSMGQTLSSHDLKNSAPGLFPPQSGNVLKDPYGLN